MHIEPKSKDGPETCFAKPKSLLLFLFCFLAATANAQKDTIAATSIYTAKQDTAATCNIGDVAPPLRVSAWLKGAPITNFEKGKVYVIDFWATWCGPCKVSMPHLSGLARKYKKITFSAVDVFEKHEYGIRTMAKLKAFVDSMGRKMNFNVAVEDTSFTVHDWFDAFHQEHYIPTSFVIDGKGRIAWIGHPLNLDTVLQRIVDTTWNAKAESVRRNFDGYIDSLDAIVYAKVRNYRGNYSNLNDFGFPDSVLMVIDPMVKKEPKLKYAPLTADYTFAALLMKDPHKAYEFGKEALASHYRWWANRSIISNIRDDSRKLKTPAEICLLGAECMQAKIDRYPYYTNSDMAKEYQEMAEWYRQGGEKAKAIAAEKNAIRHWEKDLKDSSK
jgi:thiol-disulfide isomerase/thioredoxin